MSCAICEQRKPKRFCPAVHGKICAQCCGEQREVTLDCPSECPYLQQSREHANGQSDHLADDYRQAILSELKIPEDQFSEHFLYEREHLIFGLSYALAKSARTDRQVTDRDLIAAMAALVKSHQTVVNSHLIYTPATSNLAQQAIAETVAEEVEATVRDFREAERGHLAEIAGGAYLRDADVLQILIFLLRLAMSRTSGRPKSRAFLDFLFAQFPEKESGLIVPEEAASRIIIP